MSVIVNIISAVIKSVVGDNIGNELVNEVIGISIDEVSEKGIDKIRDFINGEKAKIEHIFSKESMKSLSILEENIDYVVAEIKDLLSEVEITDDVLRQCKYDSMNLSAFLWNEYCGHKNDHIECESDIKKGLFAVSEALIKLVRESEDFEKDILIHISNSVDEMRIEEQIDSQNIMRKLDRLEESNQAIYHKVSKNSYVQNIKQKIIKSRTQEYADKWNENMFLNNFDKRDENAGVNVQLGEVYLDEHLPHYIWKQNKNKSDDLKDFLSEYINERDNNKMLLILGQPGIGKSTLITWIIANFKNKRDDILVFRFVSDLKSIVWRTNLLNEIVDVLNLSRQELEGKILILDGYDEINIDKRGEVLNTLYEELVNEKKIKKLTTQLSQQIFPNKACINAA